MLKPEAASAATAAAPASTVSTNAVAAAMPESYALRTGEVECRRLVRERASVLIMALRAIVLELIPMLEMGALSTALRCLAFLWPAGDHTTLAARLEFCSSCLAIRRASA